MLTVPAMNPVSHAKQTPPATGLLTLKHANHSPSPPNSTGPPNYPSAPGPNLLCAFPIIPQNLKKMNWIVPTNSQCTP